MKITDIADIFFEKSTASAALTPVTTLVKEDGSTPRIKTSPFQLPVAAIGVDPTLLANIRKRTMPVNGPGAMFLATEAGLRQYIQDPTQRHKAALSALGQQGVTAEQVIAELSPSVDKLGQHVATFNQSCVAEEEDIRRAEGEVQQLAEQIATLQGQKKSVEDSVATRRAAMESKSAQFSHAADALGTEIRNLITTLQGAK